MLKNQNGIYGRFERDVKREKTINLFFSLSQCVNYSLSFFRSIIGLLNAVRQCSMFTRVYCIEHLRDIGSFVHNVVSLYYNVPRTYKYISSYCTYTCCWDIQVQNYLNTIKHEIHSPVRIWTANVVWFFVMLFLVS